MDATALAAIIASVTTLTVTGAAPFIARKAQRKEKREAERKEESKIIRERLFKHMLELRKATRDNLMDFAHINEKIRTHNFDENDWRPIQKKISDTASEHTDIVIQISNYHPPVCPPWFEFIHLRSSYEEAIKNRTGNYGALTATTESLRDALVTARGNFMTELKAAADGMNLPPLH
ncbi:hypothetical protein AB0G87_21230 [Streptomyces asoensis]|uniref:hypothetical protein n=1 Tax=Streptomyces asoensis TaxID=249586 RepID=UPI0033EA4AAB